MKAEHVIGRVLWDISMVESSAVSALGLLLHAPGLTDAERSVVENRIIPEEVGHNRMMATWGRRWFGSRPAPLSYAALLQRDLVSAAHLRQPFKLPFLLATIYWNEKNTLRSAKQVFTVLEMVSNDVVKDFRQLVEEERSHVAWLEQDVLKRLEYERPRVMAMFHRYLGMTKRVLPVAVHHAHSKAWTRAKELLNETHSV